MTDWLRLHRWQVGVGVLILAGLVVGLIVLQGNSSQADAGMPEDQQAYWHWVGTINQGDDEVLASGLELLTRSPHVRPLYLRLAEVCLDAEAVDTCRDVLSTLLPSDSLTHLYREAALARMHTATEADTTGRRWQQLAVAPALDPALARLIVNQGLQSGQAPWLEGVQAAWRRQLAEDSTTVGAAFGLGYAAVLQREAWDLGESLLLRAKALSPDDPLIYNELGRIYFFTAKPDQLEQVLEAGIEAAQIRHDLEQELRMQGNLGWQLFQRHGDAGRAETFIQRALEQSRALAIGRTEGINYYRMARIFLRQDRYNESLTTLDSAEVKYIRYRPSRLVDIIAQRGTVLRHLYRFSDAENMLEKAVAEAEGRGIRTIQSDALIQLARTRYEMGRYEAAREAGLEALSLAQQDGLKDHEMATRVILGMIERRWGNYEVAAGHLESGLILAEDAQSSTRVRELANVLGETALDMGDANMAKAHFETMLANVRQEEHALSLANAYLGLGRTYQQFQNATEALRYYDLALAQLGEHASQVRADVLIAKAWALVATSAYEEAARLFREAQHLHPEYRALAYRAEVGLGEVYVSQGREREALEHFQAAEAIERELPYPSTHWFVLYGKARAYQGLQDPRRAEQAYKEAIGVIEALREHLTSSTHRSYFVLDKVRVYEDFSAFLEEQSRNEEALYYVERARSRSLLDLLFTSQQASTNRIVEAERRVRALIQEVSTDAFAAEDDTSAYSATRAAQLRREYQRADSIYRQVQIDLSTEQPLYTFRPLPADEMRTTLLPGEAMVVYDLRGTGTREDNEESSVAYIVLSDTVMVRKLDVRGRDLSESIRFFRDQLGTAEDGPGEHWEPAARRLYRHLIAPVVSVVPSSVRHLHLVPEGELHYLPFAALQDEDGQFLMERYTLSVTPSASILKLSRDRNPKRWRSMLLLGDPNGRLPGSRREVGSIAEAGLSDQRRVLIGKDATQPAVEQEAGKYDILHVATHGRFVARAPWRSHLELHGDDVLSVEEIARLDLDAYLVTLSACETALSGGLVSDVPNGDEWIGLNQAFLAAGTPTVMASLWPIDDQVSSDFMRGFYDALGIEGKAQALALVQRRFIRDPRTRHPFFWAPFSIIGDPL
ncbi:MAG: CHAT domain-containing protein [Rhodothermales bacterium]